MLRIMADISGMGTRATGCFTVARPSSSRSRISPDAPGIQQVALHLIFIVLHEIVKPVALVGFGTDEEGVGADNAHRLAGPSRVAGRGLHAFAPA